MALPLYQLLHLPTHPKTPSFPTSLVQPYEPALLSTLALPLAPQAVRPMATRSMTGSLKPRCFTAAKHALPTSQLENEPTCYTRASKSPKLKAPMSNDPYVLIHNQPLTLVPLRPNRLPVGCKWIYCIKLGTVDRCKAYLAA